MEGLLSTGPTPSSLVVNGAIQDALSSKNSKSLDLFICDYKTMFDGLDVKTTLNSIYDNGVKDDNWALIYKLYETNNISIKTPVGLTERRQADRPIITQGDCLGPILASSSADTFGKECFQKQKHLNWYREETPVSLLTMLDDVFALSNCGPEATQMQEYINLKTGSKKLQYATDKTFKMHVGKTRNSYKCQDTDIFRWDEDDLTHSSIKVKETYITKYLGEIISSDGTNTKNVSNRKGRGFGTVKEITRMLDNICLTLSYSTHSILPTFSDTLLGTPELSIALQRL